MAEVCYYRGDYEPESYQEMRDDLKNLELEMQGLSKGFYPPDLNIGVNVNYEYKIDIGDCPFCFVERKGNTVIFKTSDETHADKLYNYLENQKQWRIYWIENMHQWKSQEPWIKHDKQILEMEKHPETENKDAWFKITCSYWMLKPLLKQSVLNQIQQHKNFMDEVRSDFDDCPYTIDDWQISDLKDMMKDASSGINCVEDCELLLRTYQKEIMNIRKIKYNRFVKGVE